MTYREALDYLDFFINYEKKDACDYAQSFKLDRMRELAALLGDPQDAVRAVHVAGTKGKGSTAAIIHAILTRSGFKAGLYTSPHLASFRERIRIGDALIPEETVGSLMDEVKAAVDRLEGEKPTFFEAYTALAFLYFKKEKADIVIYETGLGGRLDATNIVSPLVSVITPVSFDHMYLLGETIEAIAAEKAGIIKPDSFCVSAPQEPKTLGVIEGACAAQGTRLILVGRDLIAEELKATDQEEVFRVAGLFGTYEDLHMKLLGAHQVINAATAIGAVEALRLAGIAVKEDAVRRGIGAVRWPGRCELIKGSPRILLDGAQNGASARSLAATVKKLFSYRRLILVLGVSKDKDIKAILKELVPLADSIVLTRSKMADRALDPDALKAMVTPQKLVTAVTGDVAGALAAARAAAAPQDLIVVTGSLFIIGEARALLVKEGPDA